MKNKNKGFTLIEIIVAVVMIGILVTITVPALVKSFERGRDAERVSNVQKAARIVLIEEAENDTGGYMHSLASFTALLEKRGMPFPENKSGRCYVYGYDNNNFFLTTQAEENSDFILDGNRQGVLDFVSELGLKNEMIGCGILTSPTANGSYTVFYLQ